MVKASSSAWVGCSWVPSPALTMARAAGPGEQVGRPGRGVPHHDHVGRHRLEVLDRVDQRLPFRHARRRRGDAERVGAQPLLGDLEGRAGAGAGLEEEVDHRAPAQRRDLLDGPAADLLHRHGGVEDQRDLVPLHAGDAEQVPRPQRRGARGRVHRGACHASPSITTSSVPSISCEPHLDALLERGRQVLADVVGLDRQLAVAAIDQHDQLDGARPAEVDERVERGADRAPGVEHVVDQQDATVVDRERHFGAPHHRLRPHRLAHQVVAVERDVERAGRHVAAGDLAQRGGDAARQRHPARADADERELVEAAVPLDDLMGDARQRPRHAVGVHYLRHSRPLAEKAAARSIPNFPIPNSQTSGWALHACGKTCTVHPAVWELGVGELGIVLRAQAGCERSESRQAKFTFLPLGGLAGPPLKSLPGSYHSRDGLRPGAAVIAGKWE